MITDSTKIRKITGSLKLKSQRVSCLGRQSCRDPPSLNKKLKRQKKKNGAPKRKEESEKVVQGP